MTLACVYAVLGWAAFTALLVALGDALLPPISRPAAPLVVLGLVLPTAGVVALLALDYARRSGRRDEAAALLFGVCLASIGLTLDAALLLATEFHYPNVPAEKTGTVAVLLLLGYALAAAVPALVAAVRGR